MKNGTVFLICLACLVGGAVLGYYLLPQKIITKEITSEEDKKTIEHLKTIIASNTKEHTVTVTSNGVVTTTTDRQTVQQATTVADRVDASTIRVSSRERTEINPKSGAIEIGGMLDRSIYFHASTTIFGPIVAGVHANYLPNDRKTTIGFGLGLAW